MKQVFLLFSLLFISNNFAQGLENYQIDKNISLRMPQNLEVSDTLQLKTIQGFLGDNVVIITKTIQKDTIVTIESEEDLLKFYEGAQKGFYESLKGKILKKDIINIEGLKILNLNTEVSINDEQKLYENYILFLDNYTYTFSFIHSINEDKNFKIQKEKIISSIKFQKGLNINNQFNHYENSKRATKWGELIGSLFFYTVIVGGIIFLLFRNRKKKHIA
ncbi:hypothetical protein SAMN06265349_101947 [Flavobacterium resistens]|uniref:LPXTG-motif cell wall anchor domain-containing protein n=1 Tax=Flavobacterium resistens TaxID=443612 RepID=A0A521BDR2_9FLAO|nr:hypothetical protein [Flavobacterium resistens]MRX67265.1 hypothetical protein [Flavobacterium resistens]SMO44870.1 hypothetical protein SAMN06265349_101947 [Flavobacterium resistens]